MTTSSQISSLHDDKPLGRFGSKSMRYPISEAIARAEDWPCTICGRIGCEHEEALPAYRGAFLTQGRY